LQKSLSDRQLIRL